MATKTYYSFGSNSTNIYNDNEYAANTERQTGFMPNTSANSKMVNTALVTTTKYIEAFIDLLNNSGQSYTGDIGIGTSLSDITSFYLSGFNYLINNNINVAYTQVTSSSGVDTLTITIGSQVVTFSNIKAYSAINASSAGNASNVTSTINDTNISDIFESNGSTVKLATQSTKTQTTDFTNQSFSNLRLTQTTSISLVNNATYEMYVQYTYESAALNNEEIINFGVFTFKSTIINNVGLNMRTITTKMSQLVIDDTLKVKLYDIDDSLSKTQVYSSSTQSAVVDYILFFRRIR